MGATPQNVARTLSPELRLLLACVRCPETLDESILAVDWTKFLPLASRHRVLPLVHRALEPARAAMPPGVWQGIHDRFLSVAARNMAAADELLRVVRILEGGKIDALAFRGPVLAMRLYGDVAMRQFADLDVLVRQRDAPRACSILAVAGYRPQPVLGAGGQAALIRFQDEQQFYNDPQRLCVDLHWKWLPDLFSFESDEVRLWERSVTSPLAGGSVRMLCDEDLLLFLCAHGAKHAWDQLALLVDLRALLGSVSAEVVGRATARARACGKERLVSESLALVEDRSVLASRVSERWDEVSSAGRGGRAGRELVREFLATPADRLRHRWLAALAPTGIECGMVSLPAAVQWAYYPLRWGRLLYRHTVGVMDSELAGEDDQPES